MEHYYQNISGWFNFSELYSKVVDIFPDNSHFVEIGSWQGKSAVYMGVEIANSNKKIKFDCIDCWKSLGDKYDYEGSYIKFLENIKPLEHIINHYKMTSLEASNLYEDNSLDFIFIDGAHDYDNVKDDLINWFPKVKKDGIFAGHDYIKSWPGVIRAVDEFFEIMDRKFEINKSCWIYYKK